MMKKTYVFSLFMFVFCVQAKADIFNGSFELPSNLQGWYIIGNTSRIVGPMGGGPTDGIYQLEIRESPTSQAAFWTNIASGLRLPESEIRNMFLTHPVFGGAVFQPVNVNAGDILTFDWNFLSETPSTYNSIEDTAFFSVANLSSSERYAFALANTTDMIQYSNSPYTYETGYHTTEYIFQTSGIFFIGFGVINALDPDVLPSALLLDNVNIVPVPVPGAVLLGMLGMSIAGVKLRKCA